MLLLLSDSLQISLMEKEGSREGVVSVRGGLRATEWGFPGVGGGERVLEVSFHVCFQERKLSNRIYMLTYARLFVRCTRH